MYFSNGFLVFFSYYGQFIPEFFLADMSALKRSSFRSPCLIIQLVQLKQLLRKDRL